MKKKREITPWPQLTRWLRKDISDETIVRKFLAFYGPYTRHLRIVLYAYHWTLLSGVPTDSRKLAKRLQNVMHLLEVEEAK